LTPDLNYFTFYPNLRNVSKLSVIRHLPIDTPAEDISNGLQDLGYSVLSVKQMTASRPSLEGGNYTSNLPLFLVILTRDSKSLDIFKLTSLCHIVVKVEAYRIQNTLTKCFNCQKFGHIWVNCRQPPRCMWCRGGHLHKECPESGKETSVPNCCNCSLKCGTPFLLSLFLVHPVIPFQFLPPRGAVVSFLLRNSRLKGRHSPLGRRSNIFRLLHLFARTSDFENRRRPDSFRVGQALRIFWFVCI
jgi:hypothetical protein